MADKLTLNGTPIPKIAPPDPLHDVKQDVARYAGLFTPAQVRSLVATIMGFKKNEKGYAGEVGPVVKKHYTSGHESAMWTAENILLDSLMTPGQPFADLTVKWSKMGARSRALTILRNLNRGLDESLWGDTND